MSELSIVDEQIVRPSLFGFDYSLLGEDAVIVRDCADEIKLIAKRSANDLIVIGALLSKCKCKIPHGYWLDWLDAEFGWSIMTANRFINVAAKFNNLLNINNISSSALYLLCSNNVSESALQKVIDIADAGEFVSHQRAKEIIAGSRKDRALYTSDSDEWFSPKSIIRRAIKVLGSIDLDPCSNSKTNPNVPAHHHYTEADNGLIQLWFGSVYMNPPYGYGIKKWIDKLVSEYEARNVTEAIALVPSRTDTNWFRKMRVYPKCFISGRLSFSNNGTAPFPSMAVYLGNDTDKFWQAFSDIGDIYVLYERATIERENT